MAKKQSGSILSLLAWFTGVVVSLAVGFSMTNGILKIPTWLGGSGIVGSVIGAGDWIVMAVGWIVVITTLVGAVMALLRK